MQAYVGSGGEDSYINDRGDNITFVRGGRGMDGGVSDYIGGAGDVLSANWVIILQFCPSKK